MLLLFLLLSAKYIFRHYKKMHLICCKQCIPILENSTYILAAFQSQALWASSYNLELIYVSNFKTKKNLICYFDHFCSENVIIGLLLNG